RLVTRLAPFSCSKICTRKRCGMPWASAMALRRTGCGSPWLAASSSMARQAYSALAARRMRESSNTAAPGGLDDVQPTFLLAGAGPAPRPLVLPFADRPRAGPAADTRIPLVVQRVVRHVMFQNEVPHVALGPGQQRVDLHEAELGVPLHDAGRRP